MNHIILDDDTDNHNVHIHDAATYVLVLRTDYDNLVAAVEHHVYDGVDYPVNDAARNLIDHVNDT